jgi:hypothetical protein
MFLNTNALHRFHLLDATRFLFRLTPPNILFTLPIFDVRESAKPIFFGVEYHRILASDNHNTA